MIDWHFIQRPWKYLIKREVPDDFLSSLLFLVATTRDSTPSNNLSESY
jgi:hypothetical protein